MYNKNKQIVVVKSTWIQDNRVRLKAVRIDAVFASLGFLFSGLAFCMPSLTACGGCDPTLMALHWCQIDGGCLLKAYYSRLMVRLAISLISIGVFRRFALVLSGGSDLELASSNQFFLLVSGERRPVHVRCPGRDGSGPE